MKGNKISPFKGRSIDFDRKVYVYRNLVRKGVVYSIMQDNLVVGHATCLTMRDCKFIIKKSGQNRARKTGHRNVHGFIYGMISLDGVMGTDAKRLEDKNSKLPVSITYNPFKYDGFVNSDGEIISEAGGVCLNKSGISAAYVEY